MPETDFYYGRPVYWTGPLQVLRDIRRELTAHPDHWAKGELAYNSIGEHEVPTSPEAVCWCILGHFAKRGPNDYVVRRAKDILRDQINLRGPSYAYSGLVDFNDGAKDVSEIIGALANAELHCEK